MNRKFVRTQNVKNFIGLVENLIRKTPRIPLTIYKNGQEQKLLQSREDILHENKFSAKEVNMALVYGEPGLGKSQTALWLSCKYDAIYLRATNLMTGRWLLEELVKELDEIPRFLTADNFNLLCKKLKQEQKLIIIDEIDYLMNNSKAIETLRDIHDETDCPIIFVGMGLAHRKLERYKHLYDRFSEILKFETFEIADLKQIFDELSEVTVTVDAIEYIHKKYNRFRQIIQLINQLEIIAKENGFSEINLEVIKQII